MLVTSQKNGCYHRIGYLTERLKTQCLSQKSENVSVAQWIERCPPKCLVSEHLMEAGTGRFEYKSDLVRKRIEQELNMKKVFASLSKKQKKLLVTSHKKWLLP